ncbi:monooxygenase YjiB [Pseudonocardia xishanensis]|uniref:Monooxygenase YjiB n=2 Tax=Pseudonocardia xishanensis TaxID=630995 RepID=A0ABP8S424_9PSEU
MTTSATPEITLQDEVDAFLTPGDPRRAEARADPYPLYRRMRETDEFFRAGNGIHLAVSYASVNAMLRDHRWGRDPFAPDDELQLSQRIFMRNVVFRDAPDHTRLRRQVSSSFTPRMILRWREQVAAIVVERFQPLREVAEFDFLHDFAVHLPVEAITTMIGVPADRRQDFIEWAEMMIRIMEPPAHTEDMLAEADQLAGAIVEFFGAAIEERRREPQDDLLSTFLEGDRLSSDEVISMCLILMVGGFETTANMLNNGMRLLIEHDDQYDMLRADPELVPVAVEEFLRYDAPPRASLMRVARESFDFYGHEIHEGDRAFALLGAADRDPRTFAEADTFDIRRDPNPHVAFGLGTHFCMGAHLARLEVREAFNHIVRLPTKLERAGTGPLDWKDSFNIRGANSMPVRWT